MKWEYKIVYISAKTNTSSGLPENINEEFDRYGEQGWELVRIEPKVEGGSMFFTFRWTHQTVGYIAFFKRPIE
ncbi:MAG: DUF4177 domain-containing protein [Bacteroidales bacterium]|jgi:hypothetical protein|nr:DUF4177 domain-containing protein [Bacteroidales bacterium]